MARNVQHDFAPIVSRYYNEISRKSIAGRVCSGDTGLETSATQAAYFKTLDMYLGPSDSALLGPLMCMCAVFMWFLTVSKEIQATWGFTRAIWRFPTSAKTELTVSADDPNGDVVLCMLSRTRKLCCLFVFAVRLAIDLCLLWFGALYLVYTVSVNDLLLNAVALEVIPTR